MGNINVQLAEARLAFQSSGKSTRQVGNEKNFSAMLWVYKWGFSSASVIDFFVNPNRRGVCSRLLKQGFFANHEMDGGGLKGVPLQLITLTQDGVAKVESMLSENQLLQYPTSGEKLINQQKIRHDILMQRYTVEALNGKKITDFLTPRQTAQKSDKNRKEHDAIWILQNDEKLGVELELTAKWERDLDDFVRKCVLSVAKKQVDKIGILSPSQAIIDRYKFALKKGANYHIWEKNDAGRWRIEATPKVPENFPSLVTKLIEI